MAESIHLHARKQLVDKIKAAQIQKHNKEKKKKTERQHKETNAWVGESPTLRFIPGTKPDRSSEEVYSNDDDAHITQIHYNRGKPAARQVVKIKNQVSHCVNQSIQCNRTLRTNKSPSSQNIYIERERETLVHN